MSEIFTYKSLISTVDCVHKATSSHAKGAVNQLLTLRNWVIGYYIVEYEQRGKDRAEYGSNLLVRMAKELRIKGLERNQLNLCRMFYLTYPQICSTASSKLKQIDGMQLLADKISVLPEIIDEENRLTTSSDFITPPEILVSRLSFSHIREIMTIDDSLERFFYEFECIKGVWSVRELRRQIASNLYFRVGISKNPESLISKIFDNDGSELTVKDPFAFEFLGLEVKDTVSENDLEQALMDHLKEFLLEMGSGFCFEARQKRIVIDGEYYFADLVLYNRILHCSVIIELKNEAFSHENLGQLNSYVAYYKENEMHDGDNPPIGILLCTKKGPKMVEYALSGMDNKLFVSTYMLHIPDKSRLEEFIRKELEEFGENNNYINY